MLVLLVLQLQKLVLYATDTNGYTVTQNIKFNLQYGKQAHLVYYGTSAILSPNNPKAEVTITNIGTKSAIISKFEFTNSTDIEIKGITGNSCTAANNNNITEIRAGGSCTITYEINKDTYNEKQTGEFEQTIIYGTGVSGNDVEDKYRMYRTLSGLKIDVVATIAGTNLKDTTIKTEQPTFKIAFNLIKSNFLFSAKQNSSGVISLT